MRADGQTPGHVTHGRLDILEREARRAHESKPKEEHDGDLRPIDINLGEPSRLATQPSSLALACYLVDDLW